MRTEELHDCKHRLDSLTQNLTQYIGCTMLNSVPVTYCINCWLDYDRMTVAMDELMQEMDQNVSCESVYFNKDRINVVQRNYDNSINLWNSGYCRDCRDPDTKKLSNSTVEFQDRLTAFEECVKSKHTFLCNDCLTAYTNLNAFFDDYKEKVNDAICFDLQDKMNETRKMWSQNCSIKPEHSQLTLLLLYAVISSLPICFYVAMVAYTKNAERASEYRELLQNEEILAGRPQPSVSTILPSINVLNS